MYGTGNLNIFDLKNTPNAKHKQDYDWYCPVALNEMLIDPSHNGFNRNVPNHLENLKKCFELETNSHCKSKQPLEQTKSTKLITK